MTKTELLRKLVKFDDDFEIRIDYTEEGWYELEGVELRINEDGEEFLNLKSSNEA